MPSPVTDTIPAGPFSEWLTAELRRHPSSRPGDAHPADGAVAALAARLGVSSRWVNRHQRGMRAGSRDGCKGEYPTSEFSRRIIEDALTRAGVEFADIYPDIAAAERNLDAQERYCASCQDIVSVADDGRCPWCERETEPVGRRARQYCPRCDRLVVAARDGSCWKCATKVSAQPWDSCGCGCGETFARFDRHGRRRRWVRGHAPKPYMEEQLPVEPFAVYLEAQLRTLDPIDALARLHACKRDDILYVLERRGEVGKELVLKCLRTAAQQGRGLPRRHGIPKFADLYPANVKAVTCPSCGKGKARHARLCKHCRIAADRAERRDLRERGVLRDDLVQEAWVLHSEQGHPVKRAARELLDRTPYASADSLSQTLAREFRARGLEPQTGYFLSDALLESAYRMHVRGGMTVQQIAERLHGRTLHPTVAALRNALYRRFRERGMVLRKGHPPISADLVREGYRLHQQDGLTVKAAAERLGVRDSALSAAFRRRHWKVRRGPARTKTVPASRFEPLTDQLVTEAHQLHLSGLTLTAAAEQLDLDPVAIGTAFADRGLQVRRGPASAAHLAVVA